MAGILNIFKPSGLTSHDVIDRVRDIIGQRRVGHAGTLDPFADGVLIIGLGSATKILSFISDLPKEYEGSLRLGEETDTMDPDGSVIGRKRIPSLDEEAIRAVFSRFEGTQEQSPPIYSALRVGGVRAYRLARSGKKITLPPRTITVEEIRLVSWEKDLIRFRATVSKGTYIRKLASDLAVKLGTCGHLVSLTRTRVGHFHLDSSISTEELERAGSREELAGMMVSPAAALIHLPRVELDEQGAKMIRNGHYPEGHFELEKPLGDGATAAALGPGGDLVALLRGSQPENLSRRGQRKEPFSILRVI